MKKVIFAALTLLTFKASAQNCACIQVMNTDNISQVQKESFAFTKDSALVEKTEKNTYRVMFCYQNFGIAMRESNTFLKHSFNPVIVERKKEQIETMTKLSNI